MNRRDLFKMAGKVGLVTAAASVPWTFLERLGLVGEYVAEAAALPRYRTLSGTVLDSMVSGWSKVAGTGTVTNVAYPTWKDGTSGGVLFDQDTNGGALVGQGTAFTAVDLSKTANISLRYWCQNALAPQSVEFKLCNGGNDSNCFRYIIQTSTQSPDQAYNTIVLTRSDFTTVGSPNWATINYMKVQVNSLGGQQSDVVVGGIDYNVATRPAIVYMLDDINDTDYTKVFPAMSALGLKGTIAFVSSNLNQSAKLTPAMCDTIYAAGWDFANHTVSHPVLTGLTDAQVLAEFSGCDAVLKANGWTRGNRYCVYPTGAASAATGILADQFGFLASRGGLAATTVHLQDTYRGVDHPQRCITAGTFDNGTTSLAQANAYVAEAIKYGSSLFCFSHLVDDSALSAYWHYTNSFLPWIRSVHVLEQAGLLDVLTFSEWDERNISPRHKRA